MPVIDNAASVSADAMTISADGVVVSADAMTVIDNAEPVIDNARRAQRDTMERYRKRRKCGPVAGLDGSQLRELHQGGYRHGETRANRDNAPTAFLRDTVPYRKLGLRRVQGGLSTALKMEAGRARIAEASAGAGGPTEN
jgi:hypothetical protein